MQSSTRRALAAASLAGAAAIAASRLIPTSAREQALPSEQDAFVPLLGSRQTPSASVVLAGWQMAGHGGFIVLEDGSIESQGGPGLLWYSREAFGDFVLRLEWRLSDLTDNSGVFVRFPPLGKDSPDTDVQPAIDLGYEVQIDDRGFNPATGALDDPLHRTGAVYALSPSARLASRPVGEWNAYEIRVEGGTVQVTLNGEVVTSYEDGTAGLDSPFVGHIGLQNHHPGSRVRFRDVRIMRLDAG